MKKLICCLILSIFLIWSCDTHKPSADNPFYIYKQYGAPVYYGKGCQLGLDFDICQGTPIIAAADGEVSFVGDSEPEAFAVYRYFGSASHFLSTDKTPICRFLDGH